MGNTTSSKRGDPHTSTRKYWTKTELAKISKVNTYQIDDFITANGLRPAVSRRLRSGGFRVLYGRNAYDAVMAERKRKDDAKLAAAQAVAAAVVPPVGPPSSVRTEPAEPVVQRQPLMSSLARQFNLIQEKLDSILGKITAIETTLGAMQAQPPTQFDLDLDFKPEIRRTNGQ
jgi:hypothetical protein